MRTTGGRPARGPRPASWLRLETNFFHKDGKAKLKDQSDNDGANKLNLCLYSLQNLLIEDPSPSPGRLTTPAGNIGRIAHHDTKV